MDQQVSKSAAEWRETTARAAQEKTPERQETFVTSSNIEVPVVATADDLRDVDMQEKLGYPWRISLHTRYPPQYVPLTFMDNAPICRFRNGGRIE